MGIEVDQEMAPDCTLLSILIRICFLDKEKFYESMFKMTKLAASSPTLGRST